MTRWLATVWALAAVGCVLPTGEGKGGSGDSGGTTPEPTTTEPVGGDCGPAIPGDAEVYSGLFGGVQDREVVWLCDGADYSATGAGGTYFVESGAVLNLSGRDATIYVVDGGRVSVSGSDNTVYHTPGATVRDNPSTTLVACDGLRFDTSDAPSPGC
jgi:hypothetical protein